MFGSLCVKYLIGTEAACARQSKSYFKFNVVCSDSNAQSSASAVLGSVLADPAMSQFQLSYHHLGLAKLCSCLHL